MRQPPDAQRAPAGHYVKDFCDNCCRWKTGVTPSALGDHLCKTCMKTATNEEVAASKVLHEVRRAFFTGPEEAA
jgi:hypothetical protein